MAESVERFSSRVDNYARYRPGYPGEIITLLASECGLNPASLVADLGSGTGKLAELFVKNGNRVLGVEPNARMRMVAENIFSGDARFQSIEGTAEATTLADESVDFVTAGQAFHWFDAQRARVECARILKSDGWAVIIWNQRLTDTTPFLKDYENLLLRYGTDYQKVRHENAVGSLKQFFAPSSPRTKEFSNSQQFDLESLKGRILSSSYTPEPDHPKFPAMIGELESLFAKHQRHDRVSFDYETKVYYEHILE